ncbi:uncharacterized protein C8R40DRAFT_1066132 [Lentinula edodes]|uniref:uncharacterized protein n=1 Tax=Lentinula edodes TaxID=5353 RepID=UPI001E8DEB88|nr:uncharacterized protein C8R40DRAFT_1066132 [Lentinula edodes]KAH7879995.1 hypothetical protein C8R40DRAFT_1066132 [Lentinula edodes]
MSTPAEPKVSWAEKGTLLPPTVPLTRRTKTPRLAPATPPSNNKLTWTEKDKLLPPISLLGSRRVKRESNTEARDKFESNGPFEDSASRNALESWWTAQYSVKWCHGGQEQRQTLFQCSCGYHVKACQEREAKKGLNCQTENWERCVPYPFTGCLAHLEVMERVGDGVITRIAGAPEHNSSCQTAVLERIPPVPLHDHVYEVALAQLRSRARKQIARWRTNEPTAAWIPIIPRLPMYGTCSFLPTICHSIEKLARNWEWMCDSNCNTMWMTG